MRREESVAALKGKQRHIARRVLEQHPADDGLLLAEQYFFRLRTSGAVVLSWAM
ncbi:hypothetical protein [Diaphorobacter sp.]|uniref:hypothetical protein n=1 Tax=Diaphorobacter sp. TaxID=1934310 RepID=UPI003D121973